MKSIIAASLLCVSSAAWAGSPCALPEVLGSLADTIGQSQARSQDLGGAPIHLAGEPQGYLNDPTHYVCQVRLSITPDPNKFNKPADVLVVYQTHWHPGQKIYFNVQYAISPGDAGIQIVDWRYQTGSFVAQ